MDSSTYVEGRARLAAWATLLSPDDPPARPWLESLQGADAAIVTSRFTFDAEAFTSAPRLKVVARLGVGYDNVDVRAASAAGVCVTVTLGANTDAVAEHTAGLIFALARRFREADRAVQGGDWAARGHLMGCQLRRHVLGIIGLGRIGTRVAQICGSGLGMRVLAYDPYLPDEVIRERFAEPERDLGALLAGCDVVTLHAPATAETRGMIDAAALARMKPSAFLINTARGPLVVESDLAAALSAGRLAGAALDVFDPEPPGPANPLFGRSDTLLTPHVAGLTAESVTRVGLMAADQVHAVLHGQQPEGLLNPEVWRSRRWEGQANEP